MKLDLVSKEIEQNKKYILENGLIKFYERSEFLSKAWELYKNKFWDIANIITEITQITKEEIEENLILRPFRFVLTELKNDFNRFYTKKRIIIDKKKKITAGKQHVIVVFKKFGKETKHYYLLETEFDLLLDEIFLLSKGFLYPFLKFSRDNNLIKDEQLEQMEVKLNIRRTYDLKFMRKVKEIETTEKPKPTQFEAIIKANNILNKYAESDLMKLGKPTNFLKSIRNSYKAQKNFL